MSCSEIRGLLTGFLGLHGGSQQLDDTVIDYACEVLGSAVAEEEGEELESVLHLDALLAGACGEAYEAIAEETRQELLLGVVQQARQARMQASAVPSNPVLELPAQLERKAANVQRGQESSSVSRNQENVSPDGDVAGTSTSPSVVQELLVLCANAVCEDFIRFALVRRFCNNVEALAAWLVDSSRGELQDAEAEWQAFRERELQQEEEARLLKERNKQQILHKFDLRPVPEAKDPKKGGKAKEPVLDVWAGKQAQQAPAKVRYLDGRVVTTKGEKFIVEKTGEEWDGGSRGKVYTKGKRGKGFV